MVQRPNSLRRRRDRGAILLLVMLVTSVLFVIVGQLSYSVSLDHALAGNRLADAQTACDLLSAAAVFRKAVSQESGSTSLSLPLASGTAEIVWEAESGKFNINRLRGEDTRIAAEQFDRLTKKLEEDGTLTVLGLSSPIADFVRSSERPLLSMGELKQIDGITDEVLGGADGKEGLGKFLTVYSDGRIDLSKAPAEVVACLDEGLTNPRTIALLKDKLKDPGARVPDYVGNLAERLKSSITTEAAAFRARITLAGSIATRTVEVVVRKEENAFRMVLFNEIEGTHERFDE